MDKQLAALLMSDKIDMVVQVDSPEGDTKADPKT